MEKDRDAFLPSEEYLRLNDIEKEIYIALARERRRALLWRRFTREREERCPYRGLELCLQHCVCQDEGFKKLKESCD
jgi:hypothetical protein